MIIFCLFYVLRVISHTHIFRLVASLYTSSSLTPSVGSSFLPIAASKELLIK